MNPDQQCVLGFIASPAPTPMNSSPLLEALGATLVDYDADAHRLLMRFTPPPMFRQGANVVQGGVLSMMLDFGMAFCAMAAVGHHATVATVSLSTSFVGAARGESISAEAVIEKAGRNMVFTRAWLTDGDKRIATAQSTLMNIPV